MNPVAVIRQIGRFPVKSMGGEFLAGAMLTLQGIMVDRRFAFVQTASRSSFPWFTARNMPEMVCYRTSVEGATPEEARVTVTAPDGKTFPVESDELRQELEKRSGRGLFLLHNYRGSFDTAPISLISRQTIVRISQESKIEEDSRRFRPNLVINLESGHAFDEMSWVGRIIRIGDTARIAIMKPDQRCMIITLDPESGKPSPAVLRYVVEQHKQYAGVYATVLIPGEVRVGDTVSLEG